MGDGGERCARVGMPAYARGCICAWLHVRVAVTWADDGTARHQPVCMDCLRVSVPSSTPHAVAIWWQLHMWIS